ncbi:hypothetical protein NPIL_17531 [Nephila pilipes]|uniref:Uncharacterized protein n=1 Tax=Nephila pilipes TaxID=299642 RepID=A0A8X6NK22_NEPPI|nr:hypothetical protein NPIL_17531 [Nephila pilipes]
MTVNGKLHFLTSCDKSQENAKILTYLFSIPKEERSSSALAKVIYLFHPHQIPSYKQPTKGTLKWHAARRRQPQENSYNVQHGAKTPRINHCVCGILLGGVKILLKMPLKGLP